MSKVKNPFFPSTCPCTRSLSKIACDYYSYSTARARLNRRGDAGVLETTGTFYKQDRIIAVTEIRFRETRVFIRRVPLGLFRFRPSSTYNSVATYYRTVRVVRSRGPARRRLSVIIASMTRCYLIGDRSSFENVIWPFETRDPPRRRVGNYWQTRDVTRIITHYIYPTIWYRR